MAAPTEKQPPVSCQCEPSAPSRTVEDLVRQAPPGIRSLIEDLRSAVKGHRTAQELLNKISQDPGYGWESLLRDLIAARSPADRDRPAPDQDLSEEYAHLKDRFENLKKSNENYGLLYEIIYDLLIAGQDFQTPEEIMEQSAEVLLDAFEADLFVCRLHEDDGNWVSVAANVRNLNQVPIFAHAMEENVPGHPVMRAVSETSWSYVLSHDLRSSERGGESYDCIAFQEGYRSRLAFILRDHNRAPFGLIMLYSRSLEFFENYCHKFLFDCSRIVSMTVGSRLELGRDTLAKAAGGMAHVGNNALSVILTSIGILQDDFQDALAAYPDISLVEEGLLTPQEYADKLKKYVKFLDIPSKMALIDNSMLHAKRINGAINKLLEAIKKPKIMHYIRGEEVLDLDPHLPARKKGPSA